jgi:hypothetical protein
MELLKLANRRENHRYRTSIHELKYDTDTKKLTGSLTVESRNTFFIRDLKEENRTFIDLPINLDLSKYPAGYYRIAINSKSATITGVYMTDYFIFFDRKSLNSNIKYMGPFAGTIARMCIHENVDESVMILTDVHDEIKLENIKETIITERDSNVAMMQNDPVFKKMWDSFRNKLNMLLKIDMRDTISYLEAQVDILTKLVLRNFNAEDEAELKDLLTTADRYSVLNIKDKNKIEQEFVDKKQLVRNAQLEFYKNRKTEESQSQ